MKDTPVRRAAAFYRRGYVCAAEVWNILFDTLTPESASRVLSELPVEDQATLRETLLPHYLENRDNDVRLAVERWLDSSN